MKKILVLFISAFLVNAVQGQIEFGAKAGMNFSNVKGKEVENNKARVLFHAGALVRFSINENFKVQPELLYSAQGTTVKENFGDVKFSQNYLNLPVMVQYHTSTGFFGETGPQLGFHLKSKLKSGDTSIDMEDGINTLDFAWGFGLGYQIPAAGYGLNLRYNLGLSNVFEDNGLGEENSSHSVFQLGLFYVFNSK
jgi:hypothetical protein